MENLKMFELNVKYADGGKVDVVVLSDLSGESFAEFVEEVYGIPVKGEAKSLSEFLENGKLIKRDGNCMVQLSKEIVVLGIGIENFKTVAGWDEDFVVDLYYDLESSIMTDEDVERYG